MAYFADVPSKQALVARSGGAEHVHAPSAGGYSYRTPADDAPYFSPVFWRDKDVSFIAGLSEQGFPLRGARTQQRGVGYADASMSEPDADGQPTRVRVNETCRRSRRSFFWGLRELLWPSAPPLPSDQYASFHTIPHYTPHSILDKVLAFFHLVDIRNRQGNLTVDDIRKVSTDELLSLMQLALAAGERERSSFIARELSRRRVTVHLAPRDESVNVSHVASQREAGYPNDIRFSNEFGNSRAPDGFGASGPMFGGGFAQGRASLPSGGGVWGVNGAAPQAVPLRPSAADRGGFDSLNVSTNFLFEHPSLSPQPQMQRADSSGRGAAHGQYPSPAAADTTVQGRHEARGFASGGSHYARASVGYNEESMTSRDARPCAPARGGNEEEASATGYFGSGGGVYQAPSHFNGDDSRAFYGGGGAVW